MSFTSGDVWTVWSGRTKLLLLLQGFRRIGDLSHGPPVFSVLEVFKCLQLYSFPCGMGFLSLVTVFEGLQAI